MIAFALQHLDVLLTVLGAVGALVGKLLYDRSKRKEGARDNHQKAMDSAYDDVADARRVRRDAQRGELREDDGFRRD